MTKANSNSTTATQRRACDRVHALRGIDAIHHAQSGLSALFIMTASDHELTGEAVSFIAGAIADQLKEAEAEVDRATDAAGHDDSAEPAPVASEGHAAGPRAIATELRRFAIHALEALENAEQGSEAIIALCDAEEGTVSTSALEFVAEPLAAKIGEALSEIRGLLDAPAFRPLETAEEAIARISEAEAADSGDDSGKGDVETLFDRWRAHCPDYSTDSAAEVDRKCDVQEAARVEAITTRSRNWHDIAAKLTMLEGDLGDYGSTPYPHRWRPLFASIIADVQGMA